MTKFQENYVAYVPMTGSERAAQIIHTKLERPSVTTDYVARDSLEAGLEASAGLPLAVVSAPAGYGKSTLVSHWLENQGLPGAWLSLDESDSDVRVFLTYFVTALRTSFAGTCEETLRFANSTESLPPLPVVIAQLSNDLDKLGERIVLVLDDYHRIKDPDIHLIIEGLLAHPPRYLHLIILCRRDPPLELASLRARNMLAEIRMKDLRFSLEETSLFFSKSSTTPLDATIVNQLQRTTEGWPVGIRLASLALRHHTSKEDFIATFDHGTRPLRDYLVREVVSAQSPLIRKCLLFVSILDRFNNALCEALWGENFGGEDLPVGSEFIAMLQDSDLFCIGIDSHGEWFRFHHLFGELLKKQLETEYGAETIRMLHRNASDWYADNEYFEEAIRHALAGDDPDRAARIVGQGRHELMNRDQWHRLERWLKLFETQVAEEQLPLLLLRCWLDLNHWYRLDLLIRDLDLADSLLESSDLDTVESSTFRAEIASMRCGLAYWLVEPETCVTLAEQTISDSPRQQECVRSTAVMMRGGAHQVLGEPGQAEDLLFEYLEEGGFSAPSSNARLLQSLCFVYWPQAEIRKLHLAATRLLDLSVERDQPWSLSFAHYFLGLIHYEHNELDEAIELLEPIVTNPYRHAIQNVTHCSFLLSFSYHFKGEDDRAIETADAIAKLTFERGNRMFIELAEAFRADLDARLGHLAASAEWADAYAVPRAHVIHRFFSAEFAYIRILMARDDPVSEKEALHQLDDFHELLRRTHHNRLLIDVLGMKAIMAGARGDSDHAVSLLREAISLGQPGRLIRPLADLGPAVANLLNRVDLDAEGLEYVGAIFAGLRDTGNPSMAPTGAQFVPESLSERELEVLGLFARNLSNREIAERLFISPGTVKRHSHNICGKLSVSNRHDAVSKATGLGLLKPDQS